MVNEALTCAPTCALTYALTYALTCALTYALTRTLTAAGHGVIDAAIGRTWTPIRRIRSILIHIKDF